MCHFGISSGFPPGQLHAFLAATLLLGPVAVSAGARQAAAAAPLVAAAADLQFALTEVATTFEAETGLAVRLSFGSSGNFARQIRQGAPFQLYLSADEAYVLDLARDGFTRGQGVLYAMGRLVVMVPHGSVLRADGSLDGLEAALRERRITRFAVANPEHAPYGKRAEEALRHRGVWDAVQPYLVMGENVSQAAQFATSGNAQGGVIAYSLARAPRVASLGDFDLVPEEWHSPLRQRMVLLKDAAPVAERFFLYLQQPVARQILEKYGFALPAEID